MKFLAVLISAVLTAGANAESSESDYSLYEECMEELDIDVDLMIDDAAKGQIGEPVAQIIECILTKIEWLNPDGTFNLDKCDEDMDEFKTECETSEDACEYYELLAILKNCMQIVKPDTSVKYSVGMNLAKCLYNKTESR